MNHSFEGERTLSTKHGLQMIYHGPVIYVDDAYSLIRSATSKHELMLLPLFAKEKKYQAQREYRFAIWAEEEPVEDTVILQALPCNDWHHARKKESHSFSVYAEHAIHHGGDRGRLTAVRRATIILTRSAMTKSTSRATD